MSRRSPTGQFQPAALPQLATEPLDKAHTLAEAEQAILGALAALRQELAIETAYLATLRAKPSKEACAGRISRQARELTHLIRALKAHGVPIEAPAPEESEFEKRMRVHQADVRREARRLRRAAKSTQSQGVPDAPPA